MNHFCTLFDTNYLSRGLALYESLRRHCKSFHLYIFAFDDRCATILGAMRLDNATVIPLGRFEDAELLELKAGRSRAEYCWTCTPSVILYVLKNFNVPSCTYVDADIYFYGPPEVLFDEMGPASVLITAHRYTPEYDQTAASGKYCVQFITFKNDERGMKVLDWWRKACNRWCYARAEDGKFGDQKYLDDWPQRFEGVRELAHPGGGVAPWNVQQYRLYEKDDALYGTEKASGAGFRVIFYHFHYLRFYEGGKVEMGHYRYDKNLAGLVYAPYIRHLDAVRAAVGAVDPSADPHGTGRLALSWKTPVKNLLRRLKGIYHLYDKKKLLRD